MSKRKDKVMNKFMKKLNGRDKINYTITDTNGNVQTAKVTVNRDNIIIEGLKDGRYTITEKGEQAVGNGI